MDFSGDNSQVPAFLSKLFHLVDDPTFNHFIGWDDDGLSFYIKDQAQFAQEVLPVYFKHRNVTSFIRQLNMYGFRKMPQYELGLVKQDNESLHFQHENFLRGNENLLTEIKRKGTKVTKSAALVPRTAIEPEVMSQVLSDVTRLQSKQDDMDGKLSSMKRENEVLWRELTVMRHKHSKQQQIVNKLIQFLVSMVGRSGRGRKRNIPLMIEGPSVTPDIPVTKSQRSTTDDIISQYLIESPPPSIGPVIHEVTDNFPNQPNLPNVTDSYVNQQPLPDLPPDIFDPNPDVMPLPEPTHATTATTVPTDQSLALQRSTSIPAVELNDYIDAMDVNLTGLRDILGDQYKLDPYFLQNIFAAEGAKTAGLESLLNDIPPWIGEGGDNIEGNELEEYTTDLLSDFPTISPLDALTAATFSPASNQEITEQLPHSLATASQTTSTSRLPTSLDTTSHLTTFSHLRPPPTSQPMTVLVRPGGNIATDVLDTPIFEPDSLFDPISTLDDTLD